MDTELEEILKIHRLLLEKFAQKLMEEGLSDKTINKHLNNINLFLIHYLPYYWDKLSKLDIVDLIKAINEYFSYWYIRRVIFSNENSMKSSFTTMKKFFKFTAEIGYIDEKVYKLVAEIIKENKEEWLLMMRNEDEGFDDVF